MKPPLPATIRSRSGLLWLVAFGLLSSCSEPPFRGIGRIDASRAFYYPGWPSQPSAPLAGIAERTITGADYLRYLAGRFGFRYLEDLAFDVALERECTARGLARSAVVLARSSAAMRFRESGRPTGTDPDRDQQRKFANEALRKLRVDAIAAADRSRDPEALRRLFDRRYGVGGQRVTVRQVLVSFRMSRRRQQRAGRPVDDAAVREAARQRAAELRQRLAAGAGFASLLAESDDRATASLLRDPARAAEAGILPGYNYQRYGEPFAAAVRELAVGEVSPPVATDTGYHLIELVDRQVTRLADVADALRAELRRGSAKPTEVAELRRRLLAEYRFTPAGDDD